MHFTTLSLLAAAASAQEFLPPTPAIGTQLNTIPRIGLGTARMTGNTSEAVAAAIVNGFRHIDCAFKYGNQKDVGVGIKEGIRRAGIKRSDMWITSKLWSDKHDKAELGLEETLKELQLEYLDLYLIHWPMNANNLSLKSKFDHVETYKSMEKLVRLNGTRTRFIGISNHSPSQVEDILKVATIKPKVHQFELHPYLPQSGWVKSNFAHNLTVTGYAPLANTNPIHNLGTSPANNKKTSLILSTSTISKIAAERKCSPAQVVLAWNLKRGVVVIPKAIQEVHQKENIRALECILTDADVSEMEKLKVPLRLYPNACGYGLMEGCENKA